MAGGKTKKEEITARPAYKRYTSQFKEQALERTDRDGVPKVAQDLSGWRRRPYGICLEGEFPSTNRAAV